MNDSVKITPGSRILPRVPQEPLPEKKRSDDQDDTLQDDSEKENRDQAPEEHDDENKSGRIDVYV